MNYKNNEIARQIETMMKFAEADKVYPFFYLWGELNINDVNDIIDHVQEKNMSLLEAILYVVGPALPQGMEDYLVSRDWTLDFCHGAFDFQWYTPAGGDFHLDIDAESPLSDFVSQAENFDVDEYVELWAESRGKRGVPDTYRELVEDGEAIKNKLMEDAEAINTLDKEDDE